MEVVKKVEKTLKPAKQPAAKKASTPKESKAKEVKPTKEADAVRQAIKSLK